MSTDQGVNSANHYIAIQTIEELIDLTGENPPLRFFIQLNFGGVSFKRIRYDARQKLFVVHNEIDGTRQKLSAGQLMNPKCCNIGLAIKRRALIAERPV